MYETIQYIYTYFEVLLEGVVDLFRCITRPSPLRLYIRPLDGIYRLIKKLTNPNFKKNCIHQVTQEEAPVIFRLLSPTVSG